MPFEGWQPPSRCVWTDHTYVSGIFPIAHHYPELKTFFVKNLKVPSPTLQSQLKELQILCGNQNSATDKFSSVKNLIKEINHWEPQTQDMQVLLGKSVIPIVDEHGREHLAKPEDPFAVVDHQKYGDMFSAKVAVLAIPFEQLSSVRKVLVALGLDKRYMTRLACEISEAKNSCEDKVLSERLRKRAFALVRYVSRPRKGLSEVVFFVSRTTLLLW